MSLSASPVLALGHRPPASRPPSKRHPPGTKWNPVHVNSDDDSDGSSATTVRDGGKPTLNTGLPAKRRRSKHVALPGPLTPDSRREREQSPAPSNGSVGRSGVSSDGGEGEKEEGESNMEGWKAAKVPEKGYRGDRDARARPATTNLAATPPPLAAAAAASGNKARDPTASPTTTPTTDDSPQPATPVSTEGGSAEDANSSPTTAPVTEESSPPRTPVSIYCGDDGDDNASPMTPEYTLPGSPGWMREDWPPSLQSTPESSTPPSPVSRRAKGPLPTADPNWRVSRKFEWLDAAKTRCRLLEKKFDKGGKFIGFGKLIELQVGDNVVIENDSKSAADQLDTGDQRQRRDENGYMDTWRGQIVKIYDTKEGPMLTIRWWWRFEEICDFEAVGAKDVASKDGEATTGPNQYLLFAFYGPEGAAAMARHGYSTKKLVHSRELFLQAGNRVEKNPIPVHLVLRKFEIKHLRDLRATQGDPGFDAIDWCNQGEDNFWYHLTYDGTFRFERALLPSEPPTSQLVGQLAGHPPGRIRALDCFCGCGGMSIGLKKAGIEVIAAVDSWQEAMTVHTHNMPHRECGDCKQPKSKSSDFNKCDHCNSINIVGCMGYTMAIKDFLTHCQKGSIGYPQRGNLDLIHFSPPCQNLSMANHQKDAESPDLRSILETAVQLVHFFKPAYVTLEEVPGFLGVKDNSPDKVEMLPFAIFVTHMLAMGYQLDMRVLDAANYGVPQSRARCIVVAALVDVRLPTLPMPRYRSGHTWPVRNTEVFHAGTWKPICLNLMEKEDEERLLPAVTAAEAIGDLPLLAASNRVEPVYIPRGDPSPYAKCMREDCDRPHQLLDHDYLPPPARRPASDNKTIRRIKAGSLFPTITKAVTCLINEGGLLPNPNGRHSARLRKVSAAERKRAQSLPDNFMFYQTTITARYQMIANMVPPLLAWELGASVMEAYFGKCTRPPLLK
eukprot:jgi/Mesvir1/7080/Mv09190-RA.2